jgi:hypothetical protein
MYWRDAVTWYQRFASSHLPAYAAFRFAMREIRRRATRHAALGYGDATCLEHGDAAALKGSQFRLTHRPAASVTPSRRTPRKLTISSCVHEFVGPRRLRMRQVI